MKQIIKIILIAAVFASGCRSKSITADELAGEWVGPDGASLTFSKDSSFTGKNLPAVHFSFFTDRKAAEGKKVEGNGKWQITKDDSYNEVKLFFRKMNGEDIYGNYSVLVGEEEANSKQKTSFYLFVWSDEEGGERYKFLKK